MFQTSDTHIDYPEEDIETEATTLAVQPALSREPSPDPWVTGNSPNQSVSR